MIKIKETRRLYWDDFQSLCIEMNWFTNATNTQWSLMFDFLQEEMTTLRLQKLAEAVMRFSDIPEGMDLCSIMFAICRRTFTTFEEVGR